MSKDNLKALGANRVDYKDKYDPDQLEAIEREPRREGYTAPMNGADVWTAFEVSFLLPSGLPCFKVLRIEVPASSKFIFESKSFKLYLNSFNNTTLDSVEQLIGLVEQDLFFITGKSKVVVKEVKSFKKGRELYGLTTSCLETICKNVKIDTYNYNPGFLEPMIAINKGVQEFYTDILRSNCEITNQPDWARVCIKYQADKKDVSPYDLLKYIASFRNHQEFHEPTAERIYNDLFERLQPKKLLVVCQYTRRGGIDINPIRYTHADLLTEPMIDLPKILQQ